MSRVFLSHSHGDTRFVRRLARDLGKAGVKCWVDEAEIRVGDSLLKKIAQGIHGCEYVIAVLSPNSLGSEWVRRELEVALNQEISSGGVKVLPAVLSDCDLPAFLRERLFADFRKSYAAGLSSLLNRLVPKRTLDDEPASTKVQKLGQPVKAYFMGDSATPVLLKHFSLSATLGDVMKSNPKNLSDLWIEIRLKSIRRLDRIEIYSEGSGIKLSYCMNIDELITEAQSENVWRTVASSVENRVWERDDRIFRVFQTNDFAVNWGGPDSIEVSAAADVMFYIDGSEAYLNFNRRYHRAGHLRAIKLNEVRASATKLSGILEEIIPLVIQDRDRESTRKVKLSAG